MKRMAFAAVASALAALLGCSQSGPPAVTPPPPEPSHPASEPGRTAWTFDGDTVGGPPAGFTFGRTGRGAQGLWEIVADPAAGAGAKILAQLDADPTDDRYPVAVADAPALRDLRLSVRCRPVSGEVDRAVGLVFRYRDAGNYYVTRANALEENVRLYFVRDGRRMQIAGWDGKVAAGEWHDLAVEAKGDLLQVWWDGAKVIEQRDATFPDAGKVGVWTKADSVSWFDDLSVEPR